VRGVDIWFVIKLDDGSWSEPINCGDSINSGCDEITPFLTQDGKTLLFSSCGHETVGGYDIFSSKIAPEFWDLVKSKDLSKLNDAGKYFSKAKNLRPPLNTPGDEIFPTSPGDPDELLYYASNQSAEVNSIVLLRGGFDIFVRKRI